MGFGVWLWMRKCCREVDLGSYNYNPLVPSCVLGVLHVTICCGGMYIKEVLWGRQGEIRDLGYTDFRPDSCVLRGESCCVHGLGGGVWVVWMLEGVCSGGGI